MFGKMFRQEIKNTWRIPVIMAAAAIVLSVIVSFQMNYIANASYSRYTAPVAIRIIIGVFIFLYGIFMIAANVIVTLLMPIRFYRESFSDQGYLYHSLPVTKNTFFATHVLVSGLFILLFFAVDVLCCMIAFAGLEDIFELLRDILYFFSREFYYVMLEAGTEIRVIIVFTIITAILTPFVSVIEANCAVTLGQLFKKHRVVGAVIWYLVLSAIVGFVNQVLTGVMMFGRTYTSTGAVARTMMVTVIVSLVLQIVEAVVFWLISVRRLNRHLDLE